MRPRLLARSAREHHFRPGAARGRGGKSRGNPPESEGAPPVEGKLAPRGCFHRRRRWRRRVSARRAARPGGEP
eukprot:7038620-Pyramimonas_sp.AAC.1